MLNVPQMQNNRSIELAENPILWFGVLIFPVAEVLSFQNGWEECHAPPLVIQARHLEVIEETQYFHAIDEGVHVIMTSANVKLMWDEQAGEIGQS